MATVLFSQNGRYTAHQFRPLIKRHTRVTHTPQSPEYPLIRTYSRMVNGWLAGVFRHHRSIFFGDHSATWHVPSISGGGLS